MAISPDGALLAAGQPGTAPGGTAVELWSLADRELLATLRVQPPLLGNVNSVAFS